MRDQKADHSMRQGFDDTTTAGAAVEPAGGAIKAGALDPERERQLTLVDQFINDRQLFNYGGDFKPPFSRQYKAQIRKLFGATDGDLFKAIDRDEGDTLRAAVFMRTLTFVLYCLNATFFVGAVSAFKGGARATAEIGSGLAAILAFAEAWFRFALNVINALFPMLGVNGDAGDQTELFGSLAIAFALAWVMRWLVRRTLLGDIAGKVDQLANAVKDKVSAIDTEVSRAIENSTNRHGNGGRWEVKSGEWVKIAAWLEERNVYVDRYVSATIWRIEFGLLAVETAFVALNILVAAVAVRLVAPAMATSAEIIACVAAFLAYSLGIWSFGSRRRNTFWSDEFNRAFGTFQKTKRHFFERLATLVAKDKEDLAAKEYGKTG